MLSHFGTFVVFRIRTIAIASIPTPYKNLGFVIAFDDQSIHAQAIMTFVFFVEFDDRSIDAQTRKTFLFCECICLPEHPCSNQKQFVFIELEDQDMPQTQLCAERIPFQSIQTETAVCVSNARAFARHLQTHRYSCCWFGRFYKLYSSIGQYILFSYSILYDGVISYINLILILEENILY